MHPFFLFLNLNSDQNALFVRMADEAVFIGPSPSSESYLRGDKILEACRTTGADAVHPGNKKNRAEPGDQSDNKYTDSGKFKRTNHGRLHQLMDKN